MYILTDISNIYSPTIIAEAQSVSDAIAAAAELGKIYWVEEDQDHPNHFDIITWQGGQFIIEPKKEKNNAA
jgi:hypothetical protein